MNLIIDTNILYHLTKISINNRIDNKKLRDKIDSSRLFITSVSLSEAIAKFKDDSIKLKEIIDYLLTNDCQIVQIGYLPIEVEKIFELQKNNISNEGLNFINEVVNNKINKEKEFTIFFFTSICCAIANAIIDNEEEPVKSRLNIAFRSAIDGNLELFKKHFDDAYSNGYLSDNIQKAIKSEFTGLLRLFLINLMAFYNIVEKMDETDFSKSINQAEWLAEQLFSRKEYRRLINYIEKPLMAFKDKTIQDYIKRFLQEELPKFLKMEEIDDFFLQYAIRKLRALVDSGGIFHKNDILDLMIVISLNLSQFQLISLDKDLLNFLKEAHPSSWTLSHDLLEKA